MKKITFLLIALFLVVSYVNVKAQEAGQIRGIGGLALGTKAGIDASGSKMGVGITLGADYFVTDKIAVTPSLTYFFKSSYEEEVPFLGLISMGTQSTVIDVDGKYFFYNDAFKAYGLFGLTLGIASVEVMGESDSGSEFGVNIGGGADYYINDKTFINAQLKYNTPFDQIAINIGVGFNIN
ncbi:MAG: porin family protein [Bacteroidota bacterium]